jgi:tetratricopeptide (TPR) repeat protein
MNILLSPAAKSFVEILDAVLIFAACLILPYVILYFTPTHVKYRKGAEFIKQKKYTEAKGIYSELLKKKPRLYSAYLNRAVSKFFLNEIDNVILDIQQYLKKGSDYRAYLFMYSIYHKMKNHDLALQYLNKAIDNKIPKKKRDFFYANRGAIYSGRKEHDKAIQDYLTALKYNAGNADANNNLGFELSQTGEFEKALPYLNKAIELNPKSFSAYNNRGFVYANLGDYNNSFEDFKKSFELNSNNAYLYKNRGLAYFLQKKYTLALDDLEHAVSMDDEFRNELLPIIEEAKFKVV